MNINTHCPVQASIDNYCEAMGESEAFDTAVDYCKEDIMRHITPEFMREALDEVPDGELLWEIMADIVKSIKADKLSAGSVSGLLGSLFDAADRYAESQATRQTKQEWDNPQEPPEDTDNDY